jgi:hypothetical protein
MLRFSQRLTNISDWRLAKTSDWRLAIGDWFVARIAGF